VLLLSPVAGAVADRVDRRRLMIAAQALSGLVVVALMFAAEVWLLYALMALLAAVSTLMSPARQAAVPQIVNRQDLTRANALLAQVASLTKIFAPLMAGALLAVVTPRQAMLVDVASYFLAAALLTRLPALPAHRGSVTNHPAPESRAASPETARDVGGGAAALGLIQTVMALPQLMLLFVTTFAAVLVITGFDVLSTVVTRDVLGGDSSTFGALIALVGLGSVVASAFLMVRGSGREPWRDLLAGIAILGLLPVGVAVAASTADATIALLMAGLGCFVGGLGSGMAMVQVPTLMQTISPGEVLGRVGGVFQSTVVAGQLAAILSTPLIVPVRMGYVPYFLLMALALVLLAVLGAAALRRIGRGGPRVAPSEAVPVPLHPDEYQARLPSATVADVESALGHMIAHDIALDA
jgi:MFS family permease